MLQKIRDNASGPLAYVVVALITLVFGVWGIGSYFTPSSDPVVASVGSTDITRNQLQRAYDRQYRRLRQIAGDNFDPDMFSSDKMRRRALRNLIDNAIQTQHADAAGYRVTDSAVLAALRGTDAFQKNGRFSTERYRAALARSGLSPTRYEAGLRRDLKSRQLRGEITASAFAAPVEVDRAFALANQQRRVRYLDFNPAVYRGDVEVSADEIQSYYDANPARFRRPPRVKLAFVSLDRTGAASGGEPDEKTLRSLYKKNKRQFGEPETRSGGELRVPVKDDAAAARKTIQALVGKADDAQQLKALAENNDSARYTPLDSAARSDVPKSVAKTFFGMKAGRMSSPIRGEDAWYLLYLDSITPARTPPFDDPDVQAQLRTLAGALQANKAFKKKSDQLESLAFEAPNDLETISKQLDLKVRHSDWITADQGNGIGQYDAVRKAAFSDAVLKDKLNSTPIQLGADRYVVLRISDHQAAQTRPLNAVREQIRSRLMTKKAAAKARAAAEAALEALKADSGATFAGIAKGKQAPKLESAGFIARSGGDVDPQIRKAAFGLAKPDAEKPEYDITTTRSGHIALIAMSAVRTAQGGDAKSRRAGISSRQRRQIARREYTTLTAYLRQRADVEINKSRLN